MQTYHSGCARFESRPGCSKINFRCVYQSRRETPFVTEGKIEERFKGRLNFKTDKVVKLEINTASLLRRSDLSGKLESKLKVETLLVTGAKASHVHTVHTMHQNCNKQKASLLKIDDVGDVLAECVSVQCFCRMRRMCLLDVCVRTVFSYWLWC